ncbi:MAG TPA: SUMF1/EgtB/PvdO family nonheme iron enzyme [Bacteroidia bacterium]|nr:SUMF1/EgtB/PvdO family nonheme iron enzyme [Bacteroidia bacterium]
MKKGIIRLFVLTGVLTFTSCQKQRSNATAWEYNNPENGGFGKHPYEEQEQGPGLLFVQGGTFTMGRTEQDVVYEWDNVPRRVTVSSFYMDEVEVRNLDYLEYLYWTSRVYGTDYPEIYKAALPDTLSWRSRLAYNDPYILYYLRHPAYRDYPVVGVSWIQATNFCAWRTDRVNEFILVREGILDWDPMATNEAAFNTDHYLAGSKANNPFVGNVVQNLPNYNPTGAEDRMVNISDGILLPHYRLPTEAEWEYAAYGLIGNAVGERITDRRLYPWNGHAVRNPDEPYTGQMMANVQRSGGDLMGIAPMLNDGADITAPVYSYWPNDYGLYNMAGNVSEWVMDVYRPLTLTDGDDFRLYRGNVFKTWQEDPDNPDTYYVEDQVITDADGNITGIPGTIRSRNVDLKYKTDKLETRRNYNSANNVSYNDGDATSSLYYADSSGVNPNKLMYEYGITSLLNEKAHVIKGGSWKDRAYYMVPGTRRFLDRNQATSWIGFRCAMDRVGSPVGLGGK